MSPSYILLLIEEAKEPIRYAHRSVANGNLSRAVADLQQAVDMLNRVMTGLRDLTDPPLPRPSLFDSDTGSPLPVSPDSAEAEYEETTP